MHSESRRANYRVETPRRVKAPRSWKPRGLEDLRISVRANLRRPVILSGDDLLGRVLNNAAAEPRQSEQVGKPEDHLVKVTRDHRGSFLRRRTAG